MEALLTALIPVLTGSASLGAALGSISVVSWIEIAAALIAAEPKIMQALTALHPVFTKLAQSIEAGQGADVAGMQAYSWLQANAKAAIETQDGLPK